MRRFADGRPWDVDLPYEGDGHWACVDGVSYLSDMVVLVRVNEATISERPPLESEALSKASNRRLVDVATKIPEEAWRPMPERLTVRLCPMVNDYRFVDLAGRTLDLVYLSWLISSFGLPLFAQISDDAEAPLHFRFDRGFAVLMPFGEDEAFAVPYDTSDLPGAADAPIRIGRSADSPPIGR